MARSLASDGSPGAIAPPRGCAGSLSGQGAALRRQAARPPAAPIARPAPPLVAWKDVELLLRLPLLGAVAALVPERRWLDACAAIAQLRSIVLPPESTGAAARAGSVLGADVLGVNDRRSLAQRLDARKAQHHVQILREQLAGWDPAIELHGSPHIDRAVGTGRGAVLWVAHFSQSALALKMAMARQGRRLWHVSRPEHGFSTSAFGMALLNPLRVKVEQRYLAGRIVIDRRQPAQALRQARRALADNELVSFTAGAWEGRAVTSARLLGGSLRLALGAPGLARLTGAALLPVVVVGNEAKGCIEVHILDPIGPDDARASAGRGGDAGPADRAAAQRFCKAIEPWIRRFPDQWRGWKDLSADSAAT